MAQDAEHPPRPQVVEESLLYRSKMLQALVDAAPTAILALDLDKRVTMWNPAAERIFGWTADEILGQPYPLVPDEHTDAFEVFFDTVMTGRGFAGVEAERHRKDGTMVTLAIATAPLRNLSNEVVGAMAILEDITERKALEEQVRHAHKMEAVGRLAGGIAHDFNNLLTILLSELDAIEVEPDHAADGIRNMRRAAKQAAELTRQLLAFGRRQVLKAAPIDLNRAIERALPMLRRLIGEDVEVHTSFSATAVGIKADPSQIDRMLMNLADNSRDAMPDGGHFWLSTALVDPEESPWSGGPWAVLTVRDSGTGMDQETLAHAFEPFFTTKGDGRGTGLGMPSVYGIVRQSGGEIKVESKLGEGTTFTIYLP